MQVLLQCVKELCPPKSKLEALRLKAAGELLYFLRDYDGALSVGRRVLDVAFKDDTYLGSLERREVETLVERCHRRLALRQSLDCN
jgi:hypothetical protein